MPFKSEADCAYFAGLFEGEGTICTGRFYYLDGQKKQRITPQIKLRIGMTDREPLERAARYLGGGRLAGPYGPYRKDSDKIFWILDIDSPPLVRATVRAIWDYLSPRRQAQLSEVLDVPI